MKNWGVVRRSVTGKALRAAAAGIAVTLLVLSAVSCGGARQEGSGPAAVRGTGASSSPAQVRIVASFYPLYIMARNVAADVPGVTVETLAPPTSGCLHDYSVTTADMKRLEGASIFVANGAGMESFLEKVAARFPGVKVVRLTDGMDLIAEKGGPNAHVWVSISGAIGEVENLGSFLASADPAHAELYRKNTAAYVAKLEALRTRMHAALDPFRGSKIITFHEAFPYFAREFGLDIAAVIEREPGSEPSAAEVAATVDTVKRAGIRALFAEPQYSPAAAETVARETGATIYSLDPAVTGPDSPDAYITIMDANLAVLRKALGASKP